MSSERESSAVERRTCKQEKAEELQGDQSSVARDCLLIIRLGEHLLLQGKKADGGQHRKTEVRAQRRERRRVQTMRVMKRER